MIPAEKTTKQRIYILNVRLKVSAINPIAAGANSKAEKPIVIILLTVVGMLSLDCKTA